MEIPKELRKALVSGTVALAGRGTVPGHLAAELDAAATICRTAETTQPSGRVDILLVDGRKEPDASLAAFISLAPLAVSLHAPVEGCIDCSGLVAEYLPGGTLEGAALFILELLVDVKRMKVYGIETTPAKVELELAGSPLLEREKAVRDIRRART